MSNVHVISTERNTYVDIIRGIAMLLVILGHTMTGCTQGAENSFLYNVIWSLQMPLFFLVSGYVTRYSRKVENVTDLCHFIKRRSVSYLLPWAIWTFVVRGLIFKKTYFLNIKWLAYHMDSGYWFLTTIWSISIIFELSIYFSDTKYKLIGINRYILVTILYSLGMAILGGIGMIMGMSFLGIRLTLYYMLFYFAGYLYSCFQDKIQSSKRGMQIVEIMIAVCFIYWIFILERYSLFYFPDSYLYIVFRASISLAGSIAVVGFCKNLINDKSIKIFRNIQKIGFHSIEIYLTHYLLLSILKMNKDIQMTSINGIFLWCINFLITISLTIIIIKIINSNKVLKFILYSK